MTDHTRRRCKVVLLDPLTTRKGVLRVIYMRQPRVADYVKNGSVGEWFTNDFGLDEYWWSVHAIAYYIAELGDVPINVVNKLSGRDWLACAYEVVAMYNTRFKGKGVRRDLPYPRRSSG
jgi:hypothetical protein